VSRRVRVLVLPGLITLLAIILLAIQRNPVRAGDEGPSPIPLVVQASGFAVSPPISQLPPDRETESEMLEEEEEPVREFRPPAVDAGPGSIDAAIQPRRPRIQIETARSGAMPAPLVAFDGPASADNYALFGGGLYPPDTNGDVGPGHYVSIVNLTYRIYDKAGNPLIPARKLSSIFGALGGACVGRDDGDPVVLYDPLADRWLISQFCTIRNPNSHQLLAVSKTGDPAGAYYLYDFMMPNNKFNDYPKLGVWSDGYYMTDNQFTNVFVGAGAFAFDRAKMLIGDPTASYIYFDVGQLSVKIGGMLPSDVDGLNPPPAGAPNYFLYYTADEFGDPADALRIFAFHADFANPASSTFRERSDSPIPVPAFDPRNPAGRADVEQPLPATAISSLDSIQDRLMFRLAYRNFGSEEGLVVTHTVNVGASPSTQSGHQAAIRYYQLRRVLPDGAFMIRDRATFAPDTDNRWMGSAAEDNQGNLAVGYSVSSVTTYPSIRYAGRLSDDPPNGLVQGENTLVEGSGVQRATGSRWGDYSSLSIDPGDDCTFWYTSEYYSAASQAFSPVGWLTRVGSFRFPTCTPAPRGTIRGVVTNAATHLPIPGALVRADAGYLRVTDDAGTYAMTVAPTGAMGMGAAAPGYLPSAAAGVAVTPGGTTSQDFSLTPIPVLASAGSAKVTTESCAPATGGLDPGETVTLDLAVRNTGAADTAGLVGTLLPTGGVASPGGPQPYGVVAAGGEPVTRSFTFTVDPSIGCGGNVTASLQLRDGGADLGTLTFPLSVGFSSNGYFTSLFGAAGLPAPIPELLPIQIPILVTLDSILQDVNVRIRLDHGIDRDLTISLFHPDGTGVLLSDRRGDLNANFGSGPNDCSGTPTVFDDAATTAIASGVPPFSGSFRPDRPLADFNGKHAAGTWKLFIYDAVPGNTGSVGCVQIEINGFANMCCPFPPGFSALRPAPPASVGSEACAPADGVADPGEQVTVAFPLQNFGVAPTSDLVATLLPGGGVTSPGPAQSYGAILPVGAPISRDFTFVAQGSCGGSITPTLHLQDGPADLGNVSFALGLGGLIPIVAERFDSVTAPVLPAGWRSFVSGHSPPPVWSTTTEPGWFVSPPNGMATGTTSTLSESVLDFAVSVPDGSRAELSFSHFYALESRFDGGVLEISIAGGPFQDIVDAGGRFTTGGYVNTLSTVWQNPIGGRLAWTGSNGGFRPVTVSLPQSVMGQSIVLRWRADFDTIGSVFKGGWRIDDVILSVFRCCGPFLEAAPPPAVGHESCAPANASADPEETVTIILPVRLVGTAGTTHLTGTLLPGGGVQSPGKPQTYGAVAPGSGPVSRSFTFVPQGECGAAVTPTLHLQDGADDLGEVAYPMRLGGYATRTTSFVHSSPIVIPTFGGKATPYPSSIDVTGLSGTISKVSVTLMRLSHTYPDDLDLLLVGPEGENLIIMSDAGGSTDQVGVTITLDDAAVRLLSDFDPDPSGTYRPTNFGLGDAFAEFPSTASPAPAGSATLASVFNGKNPNGTWRLYVLDAFAGEGGDMAEGWRLDLTTSTPACCRQECTLTCPADIVASNEAGQCGAAVDFGIGVSGSCGVISEDRAPGSYFTVGTTGVACIATSTSPSQQSANSPSAGGSGAASSQILGRCDFNVTVSDTEAPTLTASLAPDALWPPNHRMVDVAAGWSAADNCGPPSVLLTGISSNEPDDASGVGDGNTTGDIQNATSGTADTLFSLRAECSGSGQGRFYAASYIATDSSGNTVVANPTVFVPHDQAGVVDPLSLTLSDGAPGAVLTWRAVDGARSYSIIRGLVSNIRDEVNFTNLGAVTCLAASTQSTTLPHADTAIPPLGEAFFYAAAFNDGAGSSYSTATAAKPRVTASGGCE
jgi:subtilisin-like proprotein convertase family protein